MTAQNVPFGLSPRPRVYGVFEHREQIKTLREHLGGLSLAPSDITVLEGQAGIDAFDLSGEHGGLLKKFLRFKEGLTDERHQIGQFIQALAAGSTVVQINMPQDDTETKERLHTAFQHAGAISINYFGQLLNEELKI